MADIIQSLWIGDRLSAMEQMCISSFLAHGHTFHLYTYHPLENIPEGTVRMDAHEILPESSIFKYNGYATYAGFANFFRYKLLLERGGWWVDMDLISLRPFDFPQPYVFSSELDFDGPHVNVGAIKVPPQSAVMSYAWSHCSELDPKQLKWGQTGPLLTAEAVEAHALQQHVHAPHVFCPVLLADWAKLFDPRARWDFGEETYAVHLWNELWRRENQSKNGTYADGCLYETLKRRYLRRVASTTDDTRRSNHR
jgi:hypothetical protein